MFKKLYSRIKEWVMSLFIGKKTNSSYNTVHLTSSTNTEAQLSNGATYSTTTYSSENDYIKVNSVVTPTSIANVGNVPYINVTFSSASAVTHIVVDKKPYLIIYKYGSSYKTTHSDKYLVYSSSSSTNLVFGGLGVPNYLPSSAILFLLEPAIVSGNVGSLSIDADVFSVNGYSIFSDPYIRFTLTPQTSYTNYYVDNSFYINYNINVNNLVGVGFNPALSTISKGGIPVFYPKCGIFYLGYTKQFSSENDGSSPTYIKAALPTLYVPGGTQAALVSLLVNGTNPGMPPINIAFFNNAKSSVSGVYFTTIDGALRQIPYTITISDTYITYTSGYGFDPSDPQQGTWFNMSSYTFTGYIYMADIDV